MVATKDYFSVIKMNLSIYEKLEIPRECLQLLLKPVHNEYIIREDKENQLLHLTGYGQ